MRQTLLLVVLLSSAAFPQTVSLPNGSQPTATDSTTLPAVVNKDPQGLALAHQALNSMAAGQAVGAYQDSVTRGTLALASDPPQTIPFVIKTKGTRETRVELTTSAGPRVRILNQGRAVIQYPDGKTRQLLMNNTLAERVDHIPIFSLLGECDSADVIVEPPQTAQVAGRAASVITLRPLPIQGMSQQDLDQTTTKTLFYVDAATGTVSKIEYFLFSESEPNAKDRVEILLSDYRPVNGVSVPFVQAVYLEGKLQYQLALTSVTFNTGVSESEFALPQEVADAK